MRDPALAGVRRALELGNVVEAREGLEHAQGFEAECLRARAELAHGDNVAALAALERARALDADSLELCATEVELLAALGRVPSALEKLAAGFTRAGPLPPLLRAQGVVELCRQGRGESALEALQRARAADPELPFVTRPLAQANLLAGRALLEKHPAEATACAMAALKLVADGDSVYEEALELEAEGLAGELRFEEAIAKYEVLEQRGHEYGETPAILHQRCATRCLLEHDRARAVEHYLVARRLGMDDAELGFGLDLLRTEQRAAIERGAKACEAEDWAGAAQELARALELVPDDPEVENQLAAALFRREDFRGAAEAWEKALAHAAVQGHLFEDPVPLDLAKAWRLAGDSEKARAVLAKLLDAEPEGHWSDAAREMLTMLEAEALAGR
jgi:tetratricopeptide (TPR) repeat protein